MFECVKCGCCCRNLRVECGIWQLGLFLLPDEAKLFADADVAPMWGIGVEGNGPAEVYFMQLKTKDCPHIRDDNLCNIYPKRPLVCRGHPLSLRIDPVTSKPQAASVDTRCKGKNMPHSQQVKLRDYFPSDILWANVETCCYLGKMFKDAGERVIWLYDLKTEKWIQVTRANATRALLKPHNLYEG